jgi:bacillithiol biosynthesis cysteine-adding enzyme BshC
VDSFKLPYSKTKQFSNLVLDYLADNEKLKPFISDFPTIDSFEKQIAAKKNHPINREVLVSVLKEQKKEFNLTELSNNNIDLLLSEDAFTITTGHQLCLFTGPLYFIYKIISTINLAEELKEKYPTNNFVPVFWMATEDHDFEEIRSINLFGKKLSWESGQEGVVGKIKLVDFAKVIDELEQKIGDAVHAKSLVTLFRNAYLNHSNLADATRFLVNELFGKYGIVIIDGDDKKLKNEFVPIIKKDILNNSYKSKIEGTSGRLSENYKAQAFFRDINFFKLSEGKRELITAGISESEIENNPELFSPNVLMRPLYQESILPNIAYIGGGAEVAYWMQLRDVFTHENIPMPLLVLRNSAMLISDKQKQKFSSFGFKLEDLFLDEHQLQKNFVLNQDKSSVALASEKSDLEKLHKNLLAKTTDLGMQNSINSFYAKQLRQLAQFEKKLIRIEKQKHENAISQISKIKAQLFPQNSLQERFDNFIPFYLKDGENFIEMLKDNLNPLDTNFVVLSH